MLGRYEKKDGAYSLNWPNSGVEFTFTGTEAKIYFDKVTGTSYFTPVVDGVAGERVKAQTGWTTIASGLADGEHTIKFVRSSESFLGGRTWISDVSANNIKPTAKKDRLIEFYGDSYTAGYGNLSSDSSAWGGPDNGDAQKAYSCVIADYFGADANLIAHSGKGIIRNGTDNAGINMTEMSKLADMRLNSDTTSPSNWDFAKATPDLVVVFLGTNDYLNSKEIGEEFETAYASFINDIRTRYGNVKILCLAKSANSYGDEVKNVVDARVADGDENITFYQFTNFGTSGAAGHPNVSEAAELANELKTPISEFMGW